MHLLCTCLVVLGAGLLQDPPQPPEQETRPAALVRLTEWPPVEGRLKKTVTSDIARLRKARTEAMGEDAAAQLIETGACVAPGLIRALGKEKDREARGRIVAVLESVTAAPHTRLLAREFGNKSEVVRCWTLRRAAAFPDPGIAEPTLAALAAVEARGEKAAAEERYAAALCATSAGTLAGLDELLAAASTKWGRYGKEMRAALETVRGPKAAARLAPILAEGADRKQVVAALNLLAGCGPPESAATVRPFLDSQDNSIRVAAINAMRGIVDGDPPVDKLAVFQAIELAKTWKQRQ